MLDDYLPHMSTMDSDTLEDLMGQYGQDVWNFAYLLTTTGRIRKVNNLQYILKLAE